jgi:hypothetical protein
MKNKNAPKTRRDDGENLGNNDRNGEVSKNPAPKKVDRESENTPPDNEVYVNLEPDELHLADEETIEDASKKD